MTTKIATRGKIDHGGRLEVRAPAQTRGKATLDRIVAATRRLLRERRFEDVTIAEIVAEADTNTGSFYARFGSKEALLPHLYESYNAETALATDATSNAGALKARSLSEAVTTLVAFLRDGPIRMDGLVRTMTLYARSHPERLPESAHARSRRFFDMVSAVLAPHLKQTDADKRARFAAFAAATLLREHRFFPDVPLAKALGIPHNAFAAEVEKMTTAYLTAHASAAVTNVKTSSKVGGRDDD